MSRRGPLSLLTMQAVVKIPPINRTWRRSQRGSAWLRVRGVDLRSFRKPDPLATRYRAVVLTRSKHGVLLLRQGRLSVGLSNIRERLSTNIR